MENNNTVTQESMVNEQINFPQVRLLDPEGNLIGIMSSEDALTIAETDYSLDLVLISEKAVPPVCKVLDYGKFKYSQTIKEKEIKKKEKESRIVVKELWLKPATDKHDIAVKVKHALEFFNKGFRVKVGIKFSGRERFHKDIGRDVMANFIGQVGEHEVIQETNEQERMITIVIAPLKKK
jgi:translation initiation factor IF-3